VCGSVLQCVAVCCSVLQCVAVCYIMLQCDAMCCTSSVPPPVSVLRCVAVCRGVLQCDAVRVTVCCRVLQNVTLCCSVLQYIAFCFSVSFYPFLSLFLFFSLPLFCALSLVSLSLSLTHAHMYASSRHHSFICIDSDLDTMGWLRLLGSWKSQVSFAKEPHKRYCVLQKRPMIFGSLLIVATSYTLYANDGIHMCD